ncbi:unnamed protein product [Ambrosiozyma monospora]|uniref:Unnamed protein product n=1 Tax=Ambrosiozyma monospora TaxID=43982 RepID=A0A9W6Z400_AMBMO|nr:unnamed protein product [Ambrosiozyma monospora]
MATIKVGVKLGYVPYSPENENICSISRPSELDLSTFLKDKKVVIVAAPGAFTPTCTEKHIPPFVTDADKLKAKGVDEILVLTTDNPFVTVAWGKALGNKQQAKFVSDPFGKFSELLGLAMPGGDYVTTRSQRYALVVDNGIVKYVGVETARGVSVSGIDAVLKSI